MIGPYVNQIGQALLNAAKQIISTPGGRYGALKMFQQLFK